MYSLISRMHRESEYSGLISGLVRFTNLYCFDLEVFNVRQGWQKKIGMQKLRNNNKSKFGRILPDSHHQIISPDRATSKI